MQYKAGICSMCGTEDWVWERDPYAYEAVRVTCQGCQRKELVRDDPTSGRSPGETVILLPKEQVSRLRRKLEQKGSAVSARRNARLANKGLRNRG